jgi:hypothetical protein
MKRIDLIIPTRNRPEKLKRALGTIPAAAGGIPIFTTVVCDGDVQTSKAILEDPRISRVLFIREHSGSVFCRNLITQGTEDSLIYGTDDIAFQPGSIEAAVKAMAEHFPDEDGIIGFTQIGCGAFSPAGCALVGQPFLRRHPGRKLFYPGYFHFSCQEVENHALTLGRLWLEPAAELVHFHPMNNGHEKDQTHVDARIFREQDRALSMSRKAAGLVWGLTDQKDPGR